MQASLPISLQALLKYYLDVVEDWIPGVLHGFYLEGSTALGGFNEQFSDVDFVALLTRKITLEEIRILGQIHRTIEQTYSSKLSGSYYIVGAGFEWTEPLLSQLHYHDGVLGVEYRPFEPDSVEGWILKHYGLTIKGPIAQSLPFSVNWGVLIVKMRVNMNSYWLKWTRNPYCLLILFTDWGIQWTVLGVLRQYYSFREQSITTKAEAGIYGLTHLPLRWHSLIKEAMDIREKRKIRAYRVNVKRAIKAVRFLKFIISTSNNLQLINR